MVEVLLPFSTDLALREQYINFYGNLRMGKIREDLDACAGTPRPSSSLALVINSALWCCLVCGVWLARR